MMFIDSINWHSLFNKINGAKSNVYIVLPGIDEELAELLISIKKEKSVLINVCIDNSEDAIRNGYGEANGIDKLIQDKIAVKEAKGNRISFIIVDDNGFILFPESRIFTDDPIGPNAMALDAFNCTRLIAHYFPPENILEKEKLQERFDDSFEQQRNWLDTLTNEIIDGTSHVSENFNTPEFIKIQEALKKDPPIEPDLQRKIKTYNARVQLAELRFGGGRIQNMLVEFPKKGLPIQDKRLKELLQSRIKLINNDDFLKENKSIETLQARVEKLRKDYLIPLTRREGKSILKKEQKVAFQKELSEIESKIQEVNKSLPGIVIKAMDETKELVKSNLESFFATYPTDDQKKFPEPSVRTYQINSDINKIIASIKFPLLTKLTQHFSLKVNFYDLTWDDFKDKELLVEFEKKKILSSNDIQEIVDMKDALEAKK